MAPHRWKKGESGNRSGKPRQMKGLVEACRAFVDTYGIEALIKRAKDESDPKLQLAALIYITNRAYGCPTDKLSVEGKITLEQLIASSREKKTE